jgi:hypothetical protein
VESSCRPRRDRRRAHPPVLADNGRDRGDGSTGSVCLKSIESGCGEQLSVGRTQGGELAGATVRRTWTDGSRDGKRPSGVSD